jgi:hypothetical protein
MASGIRGRPLDIQGGAWSFFEINKILLNIGEINKFLSGVLEINNFF